MDGDRRLVHQDHRLVEDPFHDEVDVLVRPVGRDLDATPIAAHPLRVAQSRKSGLPDPGRANRMALAVEPRGRALKFEVPEAIQRQRWATARDVNIHLRLRGVFEERTRRGRELSNYP